MQRYWEIDRALSKVTNLDFVERGPPIFYKGAEGYVLITCEPQDASDTSSEDDSARQGHKRHKRLRRVGRERS